MLRAPSQRRGGGFVKRQICIVSLESQPLGSVLRTRAAGGAGSRAPQNAPRGFLTFVACCVPSFAYMKGELPSCVGNMQTHGTLYTRCRTRGRHGIEQRPATHTSLKFQRPRSMRIRRIPRIAGAEDGVSSRDRGISCPRATRRPSRQITWPPPEFPDEYRENAPNSRPRSKPNRINESEAVKECPDYAWPLKTGRISLSCRQFEVIRTTRRCNFTIQFL